MSRKKLKTLALRASLLLTSLLVTLLILEVVVRIFIPQQLIVRRPNMYKPDTNGLGWKHQANVSTVVNTGEGEVHFYSDEKGFRVASADQPPRSPDYKVLALGDSFLEALQVEYEDTMTAYVERELSAQLGSEVQVVNTGVSGWDPNQYLMQAKEELANEKYDLVLVFLYSPNDIIEKHVEAYPPRNPSKRPLRLPESLSKDELVNSLLYPINDILEERSQLFVFARNSSEVILAKVGLSRYYFPKWLRLAYADSPAWAVTADVCALIAAEAAQYDTPVVFIHLPGNYGVETDTLDWYINAFNIDQATIDVDQASRILERELQARGLTFLDMSVPLRAAYEANAGRLYGKIDPHLTRLGHQVIGKYLVNWLLTNPVFPRSSSIPKTYRSGL
jgi:hypothetical protein